MRVKFAPLSGHVHIFLVLEGSILEHACALERLNHQIMIGLERISVDWRSASEIPEILRSTDSVRRLVEGVLWEYSMWRLCT